MRLKYTRSHRRQTVEGFQAILHRLAAVATILHRLVAVATYAVVAIPVNSTSGGNLAQA